MNVPSEEFSSPPPEDRPSVSLDNRLAYDGRTGRRRPGWRTRLWPVLRRLRRCGNWSLYLLGGLFRLLKRLFSGWGVRRWRHLLLGLPALLVAVAVIGVSTAIALQRDSLIPRYEKLAEDAGDAEQYDEALLYWRRLLRLDGGSPETAFAYARDLLRRGPQLIEQGEEQCGRGNELIAAGETQRGKDLVAQGEREIDLGHSEIADAKSLITEIAPADGQGLGEAHLYRARVMLSDPASFLQNADETLNSAAIRELHHHLLAAEKGMPKNLDVQMGFVYYFLGMEQFRDAAARLETVAKARTELRFDLANIYLRLGDRENAERNMTLASDYYEERVRSKPDDHGLRARCAALRLMQGDLKGCVEILEFGLARSDRDDNPYPKLLAKMHVAVYDALAAREGTSIEERLLHLRAALGYVENYQPAMIRLIQYVSLEGDVGNQIVSDLHRMIAEGRMPATAHFALGTRAWKNHNADDALWHMQQAYEIDPSLGYVGNNLAWILSEKDPPEFERSLEIINGVLEKQPSVPTFRDTRGRILAKMGRWREALSDLEFALPHMQVNVNLHRVLAEVYSRLGRARFAREHERIVEQLTTNPRGESNPPADGFSTGFQSPLQIDQ